MNSPDIVTSKHLQTCHDRTICNFSIELPKVGHTDFDILVQIIQDSALQYRQRKKDPWHQLTLPSVLLLRWRPSHPKKAVACHVWVSPLSQKDFLWFLGKSFGFFWHIIHNSPTSPRWEISCVRLTCGRIWMTLCCVRTWQSINRALDSVFIQARSAWF